MGIQITRTGDKGPNVVIGKDMKVGCTYSHKRMNDGCAIYGEPVLCVEGSGVGHWVELSTGRVGHAGSLSSWVEVECELKYHIKS